MSSRVKQGGRGEARSAARKTAAAKHADRASRGLVARGYETAPSGAHALPRAVGRPFESALRASFADVRVHADGASARRAASVGAAAVTVGRDIFFGAGHYRPHDEAGRRLLAHELVHVSQWQRGGRARRSAPLPPARRKRLEAEAGSASESIMRGGQAGTLTALEHASPLLHPVYISRHGRQGFLNNAFNFFSDWGYSPITRNVDSIQQIVEDLSTRSAIGRVTIVSHAHPTNVMMSLLSGGRPNLLKDHMQALTVPRTGVIAQGAQPPASVTVPGVLPQTPTARTAQNFDARVGRESDATHLLPVGQLTALLAAIAADAQAATRLARLGQPTDGIVRQYVWWTLDNLFIAHGGFAADRAQRLRTVTERARESYKGTMQVAAAAAPQALSDRDFANLDAEIRRLTTQWQWPVPADAAAREAAEQRAQSSPYAIVNAILWNPDFLPEIAGADQRVREMVQRLPRVEDHFMQQTTRDSLISALDAAVLAPLGGSNDHLVKQWVWWVLEGEFPRIQGFQQGTRQRIEAAARTRRQAYRDLIIAAQQAAGGQAPTQATFDAARATIRQTLSSFDFDGAPSAGAQRQAARQLERSTQVTDVTGDTSFLRQLEFVRAAVTSNTWFEIQGCRAGQDTTYLDAFRDMFANSRARPKVSAPDWFQMFGNYGFQRPTNDAQVPGLWAQQHVQDAFAYWHPILTGAPAIAAPTDADLLAFLRTPMVLPLISPQNTQHNTLLIHNSVRQDAFLAWLVRHGYRLTQAQNIQQALFTAGNFTGNVRTSTIDWLSEQRQGGEVRFRPDPDYQNHIKEVT